MVCLLLGCYKFLRYIWLCFKVLGKAIASHFWSVDFTPQKSLLSLEICLYNKLFIYSIFNLEFSNTSLYFQVFQDIEKTYELTSSMNFVEILFSLYSISRFVLSQLKVCSMRAHTDYWTSAGFLVFSLMCSSQCPVLFVSSAPRWCSCAFSFMIPQACNSSFLVAMVIGHFIRVCMTKLAPGFLVYIFCQFRSLCPFLHSPNAPVRFPDISHESWGKLMSKQWLLDHGELASVSQGKGHSWEQWTSKGKFKHKDKINARR